MANKPAATAVQPKPEALEAQVDIVMGSEDPSESAAQTDSVLSAPPLPNHRPAKNITTAATEKTPPLGSASTSDDTAADDITIRPLAIDTAQSDAAIDDIVAQEADEVLAAEDAGIAAANDAATEPPTRRGHPVFWFLIVLIVAVAIIGAVVLVNPNLQLPFSP